MSSSKTLATPKKEKGFSLVELMISLSLGLFLSLAVIQTYLATVKSDTVIMASTEIQENARFALQVIEKTLQQAGYFSNLQQSRQEYFESRSDDWTGTVFTSNNALQGFDDSETAVANQPSSASGTDQVLMRLVSDDPVDGEDADWFNCNGKPILNSSDIQMGFYISSTTASLMCMSHTLGDGNPDNQTLISNVSDFQLLYGVDNTHDGAINRYVEGQNVLSSGGWDNVKAIKVSLTLAASSPTLEPKLFEKTISLRNMR